MNKIKLIFLIFVLIDLKEDIKVIVASQKKFIDANGKLYWKVHVLTTFVSDNKIIDLRMDSSLIVNELKSRIDFISSNDETYEISSNINGLMDMKKHFSLFIDGRINQKVNLDINRAIEYTWNLTAYQTRNFESYFIKNYKFIFMPLNEIEVASDGRIQTKITYFISSNGKLASIGDFSLIPKLDWIQDTFTKYALPYVLLPGDDKSLKPYNKLYSIDFSGYVDPRAEDKIKAIILSSFKKAYKGNF